MKSVEYDLQYLIAGIEILDRYLISKEVFWPIRIPPPLGEPDYPGLTLDGLLLARARLVGRTISTSQREQVERVITKFDLNHVKWRVAWEEKASRCFQVRERMWRIFIQEYQENPGENADRYVYEVRLRVMLELLKPEIMVPSVVDPGALMGLDRYLRSILVHGGFIWDSEVQAGFPQVEYWFLYGKLPATINRD